MLKIRIHSLVGQKTIKRKKKPKTILGSCIKLEQGKPFRNLCVECGMCVERVIDPSYIIYNYVSICVCVCLFVVVAVLTACHITSATHHP